VTVRLATTSEAMGQVHRLQARDFEVVSDHLDPGSALESVSAGDADAALLPGLHVSAAALLGLETAAVLVRDEPRDLLVVADRRGVPLRSLAPSARVGVTGARRRGLLRAHRRDLEVVSLDNGTSPADALEAGAVDAVILSAAEARQLGLGGVTSEMLDAKAWLPAPGQGAYALFARDPAAFEAYDHEPTRRELQAELALVQVLGLPIGSALGALAQSTGPLIRLWAGAAGPDGSAFVRSDLTGPAGDSKVVASAVAKQLIERGLATVLSGPLS
jgi:hydroxymethylbilane synthase